MRKRRPRSTNSSAATLSPRTTPDAGSKPSIFAVCVARPVDDRARREHGRERLEHERLAPLHADGAELDREHVAEAIDDEPGQPVALGVDEAVARSCRRSGSPSDARSARARSKRSRKNAPSSCVFASRTSRRTGIADPGE